MKLLILQEKLKEGLNITERVATKSLSLPILNNVLITTEKNFLNLATTDLEIGIKWWTLSKIEEEGKIVVPVRVLSSFINLVLNQKINLETKNNTLFIDCEKYKTQIKGFNAEDFPIIPKIPEQDLILVENSSFCQGLSQIIDITAPSTARPEISGIYFLFQKDSIIMAATDSFRLGEKKLFSETTFKGASSKEYSLILPQKAARELINIFGEKKAQLKICFSPNQVMFELPMSETDHPQVQLTSRLIEGDYPNYQEIIPKKFETQIVLQRNEFLNQIKAASIFSGKINEVKFKIDPKKGQVEILSQNPELGEFRSFIRGKIKGRVLEVSFNHRFLADGLSNIKSSEIIFELNGEAGPGVLKPVGDPSYLYVVMPIKLS